MYGFSPRKRADGYTSIWLYDYAGGTDGFSQACLLSVTFKAGYVSRVTTADASGGPLPEGQRCLPVTLEWCADFASRPAGAKQGPLNQIQRTSHLRGPIRLVLAYR